jgi:malonyl-CoA O-methyltransferase
LKEPSLALDRGIARRRFDRAAASYAGASRLEQEVAGRLLERLDYVKLEPRRVLDAGSGPPGRLLRERYPRAELVALDFSLPMLQAGRGRFRFLERNRPRRLCADMTRLPLRDGAVDLVWSNMALHWLGDPLPALQEFRRVLADEGLLTFATLGPDTLKELRAAAGAKRVHGFLDMHDLGDMLVAAGFAAPVMDMEMLTLEYPDAGRLLADLRESGQTSARADRPRGLAGRQFAAALRERLGPAPRASFEVVYGHAWRAAPRARAEQSPEKPKTISVFKRIP